MLVYASCAALDGSGVLLIGQAGAGKSDLLLRLLDIGFELVADDYVDLIGAIARAPPALAGLLEVRGLGIMQLPFQASTVIVLVVSLGRAERLPGRATHLGFPLVHIDPSLPSAAVKVKLALSCARGRVGSLAGAFA